jgi:hypothetical protein
VRDSENIRFIGLKQRCILELANYGVDADEINRLVAIYRNMEFTKDYEQVVDSLDDGNLDNLDDSLDDGPDSLDNCDNLLDIVPANEGVERVIAILVSGGPLISYTRYWFDEPRKHNVLCFRIVMALLARGDAIDWFIRYAIDKEYGEYIGCLGIRFDGKDIRALGRRFRLADPAGYAIFVEAFDKVDVTSVYERTHMDAGDTVQCLMDMMMGLE